MDKSHSTVADTPTQTSVSPVKSQVFEQIESQHICPRSRIFFQGRECVVWTMWLLSIVVGSLALAVIFYIALYMQYAPYEATHRNWLTFIFSALPYVWLIVFGVMAYLAATEFRFTKRGYRYRTVQVVGSSVLLSLLGGVALHGSGLGYVIDDTLGKKVAMYISMEKAELKRWQQPEAGRLLGQVQQSSTVTAPASVILFVDLHQKRWSLVVDELTREELALLRKDEMIRLLGMVEQGNVFYTCAVLPWLYNRHLSHDDFMDARSYFTERMLAHKYNSQVRRDSFEDDVDMIAVPRRCPEMPVVQRI